MQKKGFTLVEIMVTIALTGIILSTGYAAFQGVMRSQSRLSAAIDVQRNLFYLNEKIAYLIRSGGTIDYEEYFNRRMLGYGQDFPSPPTSPQIFTFSIVSKYGNDGTLYKCDAGTGKQGYSEDAEKCLTNYYTTPPQNPPLSTTALSGQQSYGQYRQFAYDANSILGYPYPIPLPPIFSQATSGRPQVKINTGTTVLADQDPSAVGLPELYLIHEELDGSYTRTYFRHVYVQDESAGSGNTCTPTDADNFKFCRGKLQMLKLKSCDSLDGEGSPGINGIIDAWIPDADFSSGTTTCPNTPSAIKDAANSAVWRDLTSPDLNVVRAAFLPSPLKIPDLMIEGGATSPRVTMRLDIALSEKIRRRAVIDRAENTPRILMTTYDLDE